MAEIDSLMTHVAKIVTAYASNHQVDDLSAVVKSVNATMRSLNGGASNGSSEPVAPARQPLQPAVPPHKSVFSDYIVCLEDGEKLKMLKRHLRTSHGMTPEQYRQKWNLPGHYPMVCPNYAAQRSDLAKELGLGTIDKTPKTVARRARKAA